MTHPFDCNCIECSGLDPFASRRLERITQRLVNSLTPAERRVLDMRFAPADPERVMERLKRDQGSPWAPVDGAVAEVDALWDFLRDQAPQDLVAAVARFLGRVWLQMDASVPVAHVDGDFETVQVKWTDGPRSFQVTVGIDGPVSWVVGEGRTWGEGDPLDDAGATGLLKRAATPNT